MLSITQVETLEQTLFQISQDQKSPHTLRASAARFLLSYHQKEMNRRLREKAKADKTSQQTPQKEQDTHLEEISNRLLANDPEEFRRLQGMSINDLKSLRNQSKHQHQLCLKAESKGEQMIKDFITQSGGKIPLPNAKRAMKDTIDLTTGLINQKKAAQI